MMKEIMLIMLGVIGMFATAAILIASMFGIVNYSVGEAPLWRMIVGVIVWVFFGTFWVYMRAHK
jgi:hypothetical protein